MPRQMERARQEHIANRHHRHRAAGPIRLPEFRPRPATDAGCPGTTPGSDWLSPSKRGRSIERLPLEQRMSANSDSSDRCDRLVSERFDCPLKSEFQRRAGAKAKKPICQTGVQTAPRLAVRLAGIPDDFPVEPSQAGNHVGQVADTDLLTRTKIDGIARFVLFRSQEDAFGGIVDV